MGITLAIDTSSYALGVAVIKDGQVAGEVITHIKKNHSLRLMPAVHTLLHELTIEPNQLTKLVVNVGPGSYTGVRIGVTTAKTLAWTLGIPLAGVSSLEVLAQQGRFFDGLISPIIDARRGQVYTSLYRTVNDEAHQEQEEQLVQLSDWLDELVLGKQRVLFTGADVELHRDLIKEKLGGLACFPPYTMQLARPAELAQLGEQREPVEDVHSFVPNYLQLAEAEAKWQEAQGKRGSLND
ncbi:tRNA (adenosine(37)-N6)-threonylcarbamoyltransferase complex dimerization subunit type 1 TsaB [Alkalicoccobacillus porphyridii]|uniref:tRNA (Adenosine(37)-N6)-threonylcarbamoyltransferase complex dimerization subunit type 1 TsaB n=1 Tax=Alkalicoccobacillus porphyridii TaxID=2597270 RepID=A0A553ZTY9_9BACI|nr:tRNA (adenosine(37)-N6)-threonylcarbamoyltransferase complex dimerization subunit type 1 TsaB [Alkalicoccobacillus porphyridii]TSB44938.1 tRNA (adenosine(37)-N6)-threonylcarbamoyltransferase complex dimerization subunit type 1 TsaB [Alkalicoccobacillus porphyridii]